MEYLNSSSFLFPLTIAVLLYLITLVFSGCERETFIKKFVLHRSLGDYSYKTARDLGPTEQLISPEPEITVVDREPERDQMVVLACDGVWDVVSNEDLCRVVSERMRCVDDLSRVCNEVIDYCLYNVRFTTLSLFV